MKNVMLLLTLSLLLVNCKKESVAPPPSPVTYSKVDIISVSVTAIPILTPALTNWDNELVDNKLPDLYFVWSDISGGTNIKSSVQWNVNNAAQLPLQWNFTPAYKITGLNGLFFINLYDDDSNLLVPDNDDLMANISNISPAVMAGNHVYPASYTVSSINGKFSILLKLKWYN